VPLVSDVTDGTDRVAGATDPVGRLERELAVLLRRARAISVQIAREVHPDLDPAAYGLMVRLDATGGERATELAAYVGVGKSTVSRQLAALEQLGLVERTTDSADARAMVVRLSTEGARRLRRVRAARGERFRRLLAAWPTDDVDRLAGLLHRFNDIED
jgi:DNA-binding MarR family transcriptional regulator